MRILDRYIIRSFLFNYLLAFIVLVGMYVVLDLVVNLESFTSAAPHAQGFALFASLVYDIVDYYAYQMLAIFQQVSGAIPLLAAGFAMVRMTRHHELTAMLASGVSLYRVAAPIILCALFFTGLVVIDQEVLMPMFPEKLLRQHNEVNQPVTRSDPLYFVKDSDGSLLVASAYDPQQKKLIEPRIIRRAADGTPIGRIMASEADWDPNYPTGPPGSGAKPGAWRFKNARQVDDDPNRPASSNVAERVVGELVYITGLTPQQLDLVFSKKAVEYLSTSQIEDLIRNSPDVTRPGLYKIMFLRFTQPLMNLIMLLIGIPFLLTREPNRLIPNMIYCTALSGLVFVATFVMFQMAGTVVSPMLGAWLPVLLFGPLAVAMLDGIKT